MPRIGVDPPALHGTAADLSDLGDQLGALRQALDRASIAGYASGSPEFGSAFAGFTGAWSQCLTLMGVGATRLGGAAAGAATAYEVTDRTAVPAERAQ